MERKIFVDVNVLQTVPPSCLNRDDTGSPKSSVFGGVRRARVSSQSWKRAMRTEFKTRFDESQLGVRTTRIVDMVADRIVEKDSSISRDTAIGMAKDIFDKAGVKVKSKSKKKTETEEGTPEAAALFFMGNKQADSLADLAIAGGYDKKDVLKALNMGNAVDIALFGRMVADDPSLNVDATCQVAHAISTHRVDNEFDYYTAVDDMSPEDNAGAGMIGTVEFNSSTLYRYATVSVHGLMKELGDSEVTSKAVAEFVRAMVLTMPNGKQNTFANRTVPYAVYVAVREDQPVNLVAAFEKPVLPDRNGGGYADASVARMVDYEGSVEKTFVSKPVASWQIGPGLDALGPSSDLQSALEGIRSFIEGEL